MLRAVLMWVNVVFCRFPQALANAGTVSLLQSGDEIVTWIRASEEAFSSVAIHAH
jgi:hypothetical protein